MSVYNLGVVAPTHKGAYNASTAYKARNIVSFNGGAYMAKQDCQGIAPGDENYWGLLAEAGQGAPLAYDGTLNALQSDTSANKTQIYLISSESDTSYFGHIVFWNGTTWVDGGEYGGKIEDGSINYFKTNFIKSIENVNILNTKDGVLSKSRFDSNGNINLYNDGWYISGFSLVKPNTVYFKSYMVANGFAYYDENYQFLQFQKLTDDDIDEMTTPNNRKIKYMRCQLCNTMQNAFMVEKKTDIVNLISFTDYIANKGLSADGTVAVNNNVGITGYCPVENDKIYYLKRGPGRAIFCLYDENYNYIEGYQLDLKSDVNLLQFQNVPTLKYMRFNIPNGSKEYMKLIDMSNYFKDFNNVFGDESYCFNEKMNLSDLDVLIKEKTDLIEYHNENKINYNEFIKGKLYNQSGELVENNNAWTSKLIKISGKWCTLFQQNGIAFYGNTLIWDKNKNLIGSIPAGNIIWTSSRKLRMFFSNLNDAEYISFIFNMNYIGNNMPVLVFEKDITSDDIIDSKVKIPNLKINEQNFDDETKQNYNNATKAFENSLNKSVFYRNLLETDEIPSVFIYGDMTNVTKEVEGDIKIKFEMSKIRFQTYAKIKWQGSSSLSYPKKNFTIKLYHDSKKKRKNKVNVKWGGENKYCLKANYMDHSHARNIVSARIWGQIVNSRSNKLNQLLEYAPNYGAIDGFPIKMYLNGEYQGLYTWNIPKDGWMFDMDDENPNHAVLCAEQNNNGNNSSNLSTEFRAIANINGGDWSLEFPDELNPGIKVSFNNLITCVKDSTDDEFVANIETYLDLESAIDYYLYAYFGCFLDSLARNMIMMTYDGIKWICSMYDMDSTWGLFWNGSKFVSPEYRCPEDYQETNSLLWQRLVQLYPQKLYDRYKELRETVLSEENLYYEFERFMNVIPDELYGQDGQIYTGIPQKNIDHLTQIKEFITARAEYVDTKMEELNGSINET